MDKRNLIIGFISVLMICVCGVCSHNVFAEPESVPAGIAVVSVPEIMQKSNRAQTLQKEVLERRDTALAELEKAKANLQVVKADLDARKFGSEDYFKLKKEFMQQSASLEAQKEFMQQELMVQNQKAMEKLYQEILAAVSTIAKSEGYELVLDKDKIEFPASSASELSLTIQTHKVLYHADYMDITEKVIKSLD